MILLRPPTKKIRDDIKNDNEVYPGEKKKTADKRKYKPEKLHSTRRQCEGFSNNQGAKKCPSNFVTQYKTRTRRLITSRVETPKEDYTKKVSRQESLLRDQVVFKCDNIYK